MNKSSVQKHHMQVFGSNSATPTAVKAKADSNKLIPSSSAAHLGNYANEMLGTECQNAYELKPVFNIGSASINSARSRSSTAGAVSAKTIAANPPHKNNSIIHNKATNYSTMGYTPTST
jgi:hypothetical protein